MRYLLIAPTAGARRPSDPQTRRHRSSPHVALRQSSELMLRSRLDFHQNELTQEATRVHLPGGQVQLSGEGCCSASVTSAARIQVRRHAMVALEVRHRCSDPERVRCSVHTEEFLTSVPAALALVVRELDGLSFSWVSRTVLADHDDQVLDNWLDSDVVERQISASGAGAHRLLQASFGWGNNAIVGWARAEGPVEEQVLRGLIDAQTIWVEIEAISARLAEIVHNLVDDGSRLSRRDYDAHLADIRSLTLEIASHRLAYDDLLLSVQGPRRAAALSQLESWHYASVAEKVGSRLSDTTAIIEQSKSALDRTYQKVIEIALFALALVTFVDLVLAAISTSYSGVETPPGEGSRLGILRWLRSVDPDVLLAAAAGTIVVIISTVLVARMRRR